MAEQQPTFDFAFQTTLTHGSRTFTLDTALRAQMREHMSALQRELGIPLLLITHDPEDAQALADETARIENGRLRHEA